jgi:hypothetical protein
MGLPTGIEPERTSATCLDEVMPRVSSFYGIVITMSFGDHALLHLLSGLLSRRDLSLV